MVRYCFRRRVNRARLTAMCVSIVALSCSNGCSRDQIGLPRVAVSVPSPDGSLVAFVRNHPSIDPPQQSLWVGRSQDDATRVRDLAGDQDWCHVVVWSGDGRRVGFLIQDARLLLVDSGTRTIQSERWLVPDVGSYPLSRMVRELSLNRDGTIASFRSCERADGRCSESSDLDVSGVTAAR